jgi:hypothetical protein
MECEETGATVSFSAPTTRVGTWVLEKFFRMSQPVSGMAACSDGRSAAAYIVPPPPIEWPITPSRVRSIRLATVRLVTR